MLFRQLFDRSSSTYSYLVADLSLKQAVLVDPVLEQVERDLKLLQELDLTLKFCIETHIHADHITGAGQLRELTGCSGVLPQGCLADCADIYLGDSEILSIGGIKIEAIATPGHTNSHHAYLINHDRVLTGDALFIRGCGRTDLQGGDPGLLYDRVTQRLFQLPDETLVYPAHDYKGQMVSTISEEKRFNSRFVGRSRQEFIELMTSLNLPYPQKIMEAVPANERCGKV